MNAAGWTARRTTLPFRDDCSDLARMAREKERRADRARANTGAVSPAKRCLPTGPTLRELIPPGYAGRDVCCPAKNEKMARRAWRTRNHALPAEADRRGDAAPQAAQYPCGAGLLSMFTEASVTHRPPPSSTPAWPTHRGLHHLAAPAQSPTTGDQLKPSKVIHRCSSGLRNVAGQRPPLQLFQPVSWSSFALCAF